MIDILFMLFALLQPCLTSLDSLHTTPPHPVMRLVIGDPAQAT